MEGARWLTGLRVLKSGLQVMTEVISPAGVRVEILLLEITAIIWGLLGG